MKKVICLLTLIVGLGSTPQVFADNTIAQFNDPIVCNAVYQRTAASYMGATDNCNVDGTITDLTEEIISSITALDMSGYTSQFADDARLNYTELDLKGLEVFTSLTEIAITNNYNMENELTLATITNFPELSSLTSIYLNNNALNSLNFLNGKTFTSLTTLALERNKIIDIKPLTKLDLSNVALTLDNNPIPNLIPLYNKEIGSISFSSDTIIDYGDLTNVNDAFLAFFVDNAFPSTKTRIIYINDSYIANDNTIALPLFITQAKNLATKANYQTPTITFYEDKSQNDTACTFNADHTRIVLNENFNTTYNGVCMTYINDGPEFTNGWYKIQYVSTPASGVTKDFSSNNINMQTKYHLPSDSAFAANIETITDSIRNKVESTSSEKLLDLYDFSITLPTSDTYFYLPGDYTIKINQTSELANYENFKLVYLDDNNNILEEYTANVNENIIEVAVPHFSRYALLGTLKSNDDLTPIDPVDPGDLGEETPDSEEAIVTKATEKTASATVDNVNTPKTGDTIIITMQVAIVALVGLISITLYKRKKALK